MRLGTKRIILTIFLTLWVVGLTALFFIGV